MYYNIWVKFRFKFALGLNVYCKINSPTASFKFYSGLGASQLIFSHFVPTMQKLSTILKSQCMSKLGVFAASF